MLAAKRSEGMRAIHLLPRVLRLEVAVHKVRVNPGVLDLCTHVAVGLEEPRGRVSGRVPVLLLVGFLDDPGAHLIVREWEPPQRPELVALDVQADGIDKCWGPRHPEKLGERYGGGAQAAPWRELGFRHAHRCRRWLFALALALPPRPTDIGAPLLLLACLVTGVFSNAIGYGIDQYVLREVSVRRFSVLLAMLPVTAVIVGWVALNQQPSALDLVGIIAVLIGVSVQERDTAQPIDPVVQVA